MDSNLLDLLWVEKYRPKTLDECVLPDSHRQSFQKFIDDRNCPHLLFQGGPGSGKTSVVRILTDNIITDESDILILNGSVSTGVDVVRDEIIPFLSVPPFGDSKVKIVFIDEFDYMSKNAQASLRNVMEKYLEARFICTINYSHKVIKELHSRFQTYTFKKLPIEYINKFVVDILKKEKIKFDENIVSRIIKTNYPDVRKTIGDIQCSIINNELSHDVQSDETEEKINNIILNIISIIENKQSNAMGIAFAKCVEIEKILNENDIDFISLYTNLFYDNKLPFWAKIKIGESSDSIVAAAIPNMHFITCILKMINTGLTVKGMI